MAWSLRMYNAKKQDPVLTQRGASETEASASRDVHSRRQWRAWSTVVGAWILQFCVIGFMSAFGVMQAYYAQNFLSNVSDSAISWIGSIQLFLDLALAVLGGDLLDRGYFRHTVLLGSVVFIICHFLLSVARPHQYVQILLSQGLGMGIGMGLVYLPTSVVVTQHFKQNKALAMGIVMSGGSLGGCVFSIALNYLLNSMSFAWSIRASAFACLGMLILGNLLIFDPPQGDISPPPLSREEHEDETNEEAIRVKMTPDVDMPPEALPITSSILSASFWDRKYICFLGMGFLTGLGKWFPTYYVQLFAQQHGIGQQLSFYALAIMNLSNMFGRIFPNWLGDRWGSMNVYIACLFCASAVEFAMLGCSNPYGLVLFSIFYGFFLGTTISLYLPAVASISKGGQHDGKRMGLALVPVGISSLVGTPISGAILGSDYDWWKGTVFASMTMLSGAVLVCSIKVPRRWPGSRRTMPESPTISDAV